MIIAALRQTSPDRITVVFEDGNEIKSTLGVISDLRLFQGRDADENEIDQIKNASSFALAREKALELLSRSPVSRKELVDKLVRKGEDRLTAEACAQWLSENGFLDDGRYAAAVARHYTGKGYGAGRVRMELQRRGVPRELWSDTIEAMPEVEDKIDKLIAAKLKDPSDREQIRKLSASLYRRGFSWEEIREGLRRYGSQELDE